MVISIASKAIMERTFDNRRNDRAVTWVLEKNRVSGLEVTPIELSDGSLIASVGGA